MCYSIQTQTFSPTKHPLRPGMCIFYSVFLLVLNFNHSMHWSNDQGNVCTISWMLILGHGTVWKGEGSSSIYVLFFYVLWSSCWTRIHTHCLVVLTLFLISREWFSKKMNVTRNGSPKILTKMFFFQFLSLRSFEISLYKIIIYNHFSAK